ncbi:hypothetical protein JHL17_18890 [Azospirillum sp. YIM B02556]|uniref:CopG family transcriptional regulator n=1 Tax=Azospirillum endophyticum TaxID=2800326 RepID=A0ABS1F7S4_9PROT|nr:hypothetical protein [Azospirillum endophyticum]MBK1839481.1 hypothetical protein [Azospirillum endophyticum]
MTARDQTTRASRGPATSQEVQLCVMVSSGGRDAIRAEAVRRGMTVRALVLEALRSANVPGLEGEEGGDRRIAAATLRARVWRDYRDGGTR